MKDLWAQGFKRCYSLCYTIMLPGRKSGAGFRPVLIGKASNSPLRPAGDIHGPTPMKSWGFDGRFCRRHRYTLAAAIFVHLRPSHAFRCYPWAHRGTGGGGMLRSQCFRAGNRASGPDAGRIPIGKSSKSAPRSAFGRPQHRFRSAPDYVESGRSAARKPDFRPGSTNA